MKKKRYTEEQIIEVARIAHERDEHPRDVWPEVLEK